MNDELVAQYFVGIDWAHDYHVACVVSPAGEVAHEETVQHSATALDDFGRSLSALVDGANAAVFVAIEVPHGPVVEVLLERGFTVFSINPKQLDRFRDRFSVAGAKDDRLDALVLGDSLRTDMHRFRQLRVDAPEVIALREWSRMHDELKQEQNRLNNRMREQLRRYYIQLLNVGDVSEKWVLDLWEKAPTPDKARRLRLTTFTKLLKKRRVRRTTATTVREALRQPALVVAPGTVEAASAHIRMLVPRLRLVAKQLDQCEKRLARVLDELQAEPDDEETTEQRDAAIMLSFPGLGTINTAALLAEASQAIATRDYHALRALAGQAPITRRSGKRLRVVIMRRACNGRLRNALYHWARVACQNDEYCAAQYAALRARGHGHARALRSVGDRLLQALCAALRSGELYDPVLRRGRKTA